MVVQKSHPVWDVCRSLNSVLRGSGYEVAPDKDSRAEAIKYLCEWWQDAADYSEYEADNYGERSNPFENPEAYMVRMVICGIGYLLSRCEVVDESWNDEL